jgi:predicted DNA-binding protein (UPF0251 family)/predicted Fe-Mo cluster-binding NifX family protein
MGRDKLKRNLQFKPMWREFQTKGLQTEETIHLLHEEMEALYLMDAQGLYQADGAKEMGVSRPTFARIIKSAREKVTMMLITGANLKIEDEKDDCWVMIPSQSKESIEESLSTAKYLHIYEIKDKEIIERKVIANPAEMQKLRPGQVIPSLCNQEKINFFISNSVGAGLKNALLSKGVYSFEIKSEITLKKICKMVQN